MMMLKQILGVGAISLMLVSCGEKVDEAAEAMSNMKSIAETADEAQKTQDVLTKRREERRAKGDTLALAPDEIKKFLPGDIDGYKAEEPETQSMDMQGMSWSVASKEYRKDDGSTVKVTITDYNATADMWAGATMMFAIKWSVDNATETSKTIQTDDPYVNGHERFGKQDKSAAITYGLGGRFLLQIEGTNQTNTEFLKSIASRMDLKKMAGM
ncbi:MAG TPA: hypothetical protein VK147_06960 [Candidatus Didemnitutus sp.]|nr:hypothetical protein [Candidatus Didemnitutus sp.]